MLTSEDFLESIDGLLKSDEFAFVPSEDFCHLEGLWKVALDFPGARHSQFVILWKLIHTQNGDDVLEWFVILQYFLNATSNI